MIKVRSKNHDNSEAILNENNILYVVPSYDGTIVYFVGGGYLILSNNIESIDEKFKALLEVPKLDQPKSVIPSSIVTDVVDANLTLDEFPAHLKRMSNGKVDPRTREYKEYISTQTGV